MNLTESVTKHVESAANGLWEEFKAKPVKASLKLLVFIVIANWVYERIFGTQQTNEAH